MNFKRIFVLLVLAILSITLFACSDKEDQGEVIAVVNGEDVYEKPLERLLADMKFMYEQQGISFEGEQGEMFLDMLRDQALDQLIQQTVLMQEAKAHDLLVSDEKVQEELDIIKAQFESDELYQEALTLNNLTEKELKESLFENLTLQNLMDAKIETSVITDEEVFEYYEEYVESIEKAKAEIIDEQGELTPEQEEMYTIPEYEDVKENIRDMLENEERQEKMQVYIDNLMEESTIEIIDNK